MKKENVQITAKGIKSALKRYNYMQSIAEYIWNGFDAKATHVDISFTENELGAIEQIKILDNGYGINHDELTHKFKPFYDSEKTYEPEAQASHSTVHGKNGIGRLTFFTFARAAKWRTVYAKNNKNYVYEIGIHETQLEFYTGKDDTPKATSEPTGTAVVFDDVFELMGKSFPEISEFLKVEFGWFLELNQHLKYSLTVNGVPLDCSAIISDREERIITHSVTKTKFKIKYVQWTQKLNKEFSRYYYLGTDNHERWKEFTTLNNKGDHFYHSVYVQSDYFDNFAFAAQKDAQVALLGGSRTDKQFQYLEQELERYLKAKRKPFLKRYSDILIQQYEQEGCFPVFSSDKWDTIKKQELEDTVKGLYEVQPKLFAQFNIEQKKTFVGLLSLVLDSGEREKLMTILEQVVDLEPSERAELADLFKKTRLGYIIKTIKLIEDRYAAVENLKNLVFNEKLKANEIDHIQKVVEKHYWIFGEQYHIVAAAEQKFETALKNYLYILKGEKKPVKINHPDKNKEMDIFICKQDIQDGQQPSIENIVVELKAPTVALGKKELDQVETYLRTIINVPEFNDKNTKWTFYLVGNKLKKSPHEATPYIQDKIDSYRVQGERDLAAINAQQNYKVYVKTWSQIFNDFTCKHKFLDDKLKLEKEALLLNFKSADKIVASINTNTAAV